MQKTIYINSSARDAGGSNEDFTITRSVTEFVGTPKSARVVSAAIPYTWGNVVASNNTFTITETTVGSDDFVIPDDNYTGATLATAVAALINASGVLVSTFTVVFNTTTGFTITSNTNTFRIIFAAIGSAAEILGFVAGSTNPGAAALTVSSTVTDGDNFTVISGNNTFTINENTVGVDDFIIPEGYYTGTTLATAMATLINASTVLTSTFTVTFDTDTLEFTIASGTNTFQIIFDAVGSASGLLGFAAGTTNPAAPALEVTSLVGAALLPDYEIFLCSNLVTGSDNGVIVWSPSYVPDSTNQTQILARIPIAGCYSGVINYSANAKSPAYNVTQSSFVQQIKLGVPASMRFFLSLPSGLPIDLQGYHWTAEIVMQF